MTKKSHQVLSFTLFLFLLSALVLSPSQASLQSRSASPAAVKLLAGQPLTEYRQRRERLMEQTKDGVVLMSGANDDEFGEVGKFRQRNDFMYLTGVAAPGAILALVPQGYGPSNAREILFLPPRNPRMEQWTGPKIGPGEEAQREFGFQLSLPTAEFDSAVKQILEKTKIVYSTVTQGASGRFSREQAFAERISGTGAELKSVRPLIAEMRRIKSPSEIEMLRETVRITGEAHNDVARAVRPGMYEYQLEALIMAAFLRNGAPRAGFPSIVGSGPYSTVLHYNENTRKIADGDLIVVDIGSEYNYYSADITRTYPANGRFTDRQRQIYELVLGAQKAAEAAFKLGQSTMRDLNQVAREFIRSSPLRSKDGRTLDTFFIHGLSHYLGMDVHDVGQAGKPLVPGAVFTIEPGIYLPDENLGVRIEDDYVVTESGLVKISRDIPSAADQIEKLMARKTSSARSN
jgi:Xaa-Pro aminopeptidase